MLFITNRFPTQSIRTRAGRKFTFDLKNNAASNSVYYCESGAGEDHVELGSKAFLGRIKESAYAQVLLYVHGYSNLPDVVLDRARALQAYFDAAKPGETLVIALIWPCDDDRGIVEDYWDDQKSADLSGYSFARVLERFLAWRAEDASAADAAPCLKRINLLAHSMGNRVLRASLATWDRYDLASGVPLIFRNTFMVAADVVNETLHEGQPGELIAHASRNVVVYYASDDLALRASKAANLKNKVASRRLGHTGPENITKTPRNVFQVDCDDINTRYDRPMGHSYFLADPDTGEAGLVFRHILRCITQGRVFPGDMEQRSDRLR